MTSRRSTRTTARATALASVVLMGTLAACSPGTDADEQADGQTEGQAGEQGAAGETPAQLESGTLTVGTEGTYRPFSYHEGGSGDLTGYDVEVARAVAEELGVEVRFEETQWDAMFAGLEAGRFDMIANQVSITPEREEVYAFSEPYTYSRGVIVVREDDDSINSFADLDGRTAAQSLTSNWRTLAEENGARIEGVEGWAQSVALVEQRRVDATINDLLTFLDYQQQNGAEGLRVAAETDDMSRAAFAFMGENAELADAVSEALATLAENGTLAELSETYFGQDVSAP